MLKSKEFESDEAFEEAFKLEANVLRAMKSLKTPHLIQTIACYRKGKEHCFVFPWAESGNLRDYWKKHDRLSQKERLSPGYLRWVFRQLQGLAEGINLLHSEIIRHGDLKPENILCFSDPQSDSKGVPTSCILVIADAGLAKVNYQATQLRTRATIGPKGGTLMYEPPEAEVAIDQPVSRRYDVWSMGCISLEFLIWLLYGESGLNSFREQLGQSGKFYEPRWSKDELRVTGAGPQPTVERWIKSIRDLPFSEGDRNPLGRLIRLIDKKLLVHSLGTPIRLPPRPSRDTLGVTLGVDIGGAARAPVGHNPITRARRTDTAAVMGATTFDLPSGSRLTSDKMLDEFKEILKDKKSFDFPAEALARSEQSLQLPSDTRAETDSLSPPIGNPGVRNNHTP